MRTLLLSMFGLMGFGLTVAVGAAVNGAAPSKPAKPNIVIIVADDMGFSDAGCYGGEI
jgi:arylsulfatase